MGGVTSWMKAVVVPLVVLAIWLFPTSRPEVVVAGTIARPVLEGPTSTVAVEPLADASPVVVTDDVVTTTSAPASITTVLTVPPVSATTDPPQTSTTALDVVTSSLATEVTTTIATSLGEQALARVQYPWRERFPEWTVDFSASREGIRALTYPAEKRIEVFVRPSDTAATLHRVFAHELGHLVDVERNDDADRARWFEARGIAQRTPWWPSASSPDFDTGAGDFAEAFAVWETGVSSRSTVAGQPNADDLELLRELSR